MSDDVYESGLAVRKAVVGVDYVNKSLAEADDFTKPLQDLVTTYCWGAVWTRDGLSRKTRSLLNVVMLTVLNRPHELKIHVRGALRNGCTQEEIREALLQAGVYGGVPAAVDAFRVAKEVLAEPAPDK
ncbi:carboxymuconolactone decarboxylase family protein [Paralcaligenes sp. KSB-10]|uniref:carboxymuconolactone decarboxylase family protein n=1 Tax=Paralcaligenes sp. KSB-10 TaxID=2901142 RepID=UPI001E2EA7F6|nr:carboxymuconolactone decarboxylase family protein [Paralcaligenes sp. KSB-10]UHL63972.1 carboxymuconolactone decarboxylase family protein [Paralcaligenes sp. KSB-10]